MILHVASLDKFIPPFIDFLAKNFDSSQHRFWLNGDRNRYPYQDNTSTYQVKPGFLGEATAYLRLAMELNRAEKVILHGLFDPKIIIILSSMPWLLRNCYWIIWGGDLYVRNLEKKNWKWHLGELFRSFVIKRIGHLVTYIEGDVDLARKWYGATGKHHECLMYTSNLYSDPNAISSHKKTINIQVGNSADPSNNHIEALKKLLPYKDSDIKIHVPLSYGDQAYASTVIRQGSEWFGEKLKPLTDFMPLEEYLELLGDIDIAMFNHRRQQAMGNTITLLGLGKKVFLRSDVTPWKMFKKNKITVYDIEDFDISPMDTEISKKNQEFIREHFSREKLALQLKEVFES
ncbi:TDP-N-acetylfucosamine:lipid II N-acetylfucosaminyltransferase [Pseudomonas sp. AN-1]|uniref:TDP-N-acetylfucosamine:lipid II N-acetylfucosaminyltransferase n=1 Tax=Pseudomonas sp. AN-1 TaxID=3096605 RepID=UPI002A6A7B2A|nr:TDP-N-acetylfucosamine:lipid II N-acetylfucosaminyltransferase [Pseudomonas sp. AN-1]WPP47387.1 TDP-N-acetylfucosamine:lipid II N-acetylfucosaminyltransferase [Pseudomonas sp. AN-1]